MNNIKNTIAYPFTRTKKLDWAIFSVVLVLGAMFAWYIYSINLTTAMVDQYSHLSIARQVVDSRTPGISQLGFWPPLLHILMVPTVMVDWLYETGLAAAATLVPILAFSAVLFYHLMFLLTRNKWVSLATVALYVLNPYILYYSVSPMTDALYMGIMIMAVYFFVHWWKTDSLISLLLMSLIVGISPMARFEGFALVAMVGLFVLIRLVMKKVSYHKIESTAVLYGLLASIGVIFILVYGMIFNDNPLAFLNDKWSAYDQQEDYELLTKHNPDVAFLYLTHTAAHMIGWVMVILGWMAFILAPLVVRRDILLNVFTVLLLLSPFMFDLLALVQGSAVIQIPELPPYNQEFFNERYGVTFLLFAVTSIGIAVAGLLRQFKQISWYFVPAGVLISAVVLMVAANGTLTLLKDTAFTCGDDCYHTVQNSRQVSPESHTYLAKAIEREYDGGNILITRALHNEVVVKAGVPLKNYVVEGNQYYYEQAIDYPWLFARWVVMYSDDINTLAWYLEREEVAKRWAGNDEFNYYYERVFDSNHVDLYRVREARVREYAFQAGIKDESLPSLERGGPGEWDVEHTYRELVEQIENMEKEQGTSSIAIR